MLRRIFAAKGFHIGLMFAEAAAKHGSVPITLDAPMQLAPEYGVDFTIARFAQLIDEMAAKLAEVGVRAKDKVAIHKTDNVDIVVLACAVSRLGAVPALLSPALDAPVVVQLLGRLDRPWLITDADKLAGSLAEVDVSSVVRQTLLSAGDAPDALSLAGVTASGPVTPVRLAPREPALITHSSGTTGVPKLAVHCANSLWHRLLPQKMMAWPIRKRETAALCMTFVHSRFYNALCVFLSFGNPLVIASDWRPENIGELFARTRPGYVESQPNTYIEWEELVDHDRAPLANVRCYGGTFDAMHPRTIQKLLAGSKRRNPLFIQLYGQSETGPCTGRWYTKRTAAKTDGRSMGMPLPGFVKLRVTGPDGKRVSRGEVGNLEVKLRSRVLTYHGEEARYNNQFNGDWWRMGDMGYRSRAGFVFLLDREQDRIASMDSNLAAEDTLMSRLDELREVVIVAGRDGEPVPVVCTRGDRPVDLARWRAATNDLPAMADPIQLRFEDIPHTSTWKVRRSELAKKLAA